MMGYSCGTLVLMCAMMSLLLKYHVIMNASNRTVQNNMYGVGWRRVGETRWGEVMGKWNQMEEVV